MDVFTHNTETKMKSTKRKFDSNAYDEDSDDDSDDELPDYWKLLRGNADELGANGKEVIEVDDSDEDIEQSGILIPQRSCPKVIKQHDAGKGPIQPVSSLLPRRSESAGIVALTGISRRTGCILIQRTMGVNKNSSASSIHPTTSESSQRNSMEFEAINMVTQESGSKTCIPSAAFRITDVSKYRTKIPAMKSQITGSISESFTKLSQIRHASSSSTSTHAAQTLDSGEKSNEIKSCFAKTQFAHVNSSKANMVPAETQITRGISPQANIVPSKTQIIQGISPREDNVPTETQITKGLTGIIPRADHVPNETKNTNGISLQANKDATKSKVVQISGSQSIRAPTKKQFPQLKSSQTTEAPDKNQLTVLNSSRTTETPSRNQLLYNSQVTKTDDTKPIIHINNSHALSAPLPNHSTYLNTAQTSRTNPKNDGSETNRLVSADEVYQMNSSQVTSSACMSQTSLKISSKVEISTSKNQAFQCNSSSSLTNATASQMNMTQGISLTSKNHISQANRSSPTYQSSGANGDYQASITANEAQQRHVNSLLTMCSTSKSQTKQSNSPDTNSSKISQIPSEKRSSSSGISSTLKIPTDLSSSHMKRFSMKDKVAELNISQTITIASTFPTTTKSLRNESFSRMDQVDKLTSSQTKSTVSKISVTANSLQTDSSPKMEHVKKLNSSQTKSTVSKTTANTNILQTASSPKMEHVKKLNGSQAKSTASKATATASSMQTDSFSRKDQVEKLNSSRTTSDASTSSMSKSPTTMNSSSKDSSQTKNRISKPKSFHSLTPVSQVPVNSGSKIIDFYPIKHKGVKSNLLQQSRSIPITISPAATVDITQAPHLNTAKPALDIPVTHKNRKQSKKRNQEVDLEMERIVKRRKKNPSTQDGPSESSRTPTNSGKHVSSGRSEDVVDQTGKTFGRVKLIHGTNQSAAKFSTEILEKGKALDAGTRSLTGLGAHAQLAPLAKPDPNHLPYEDHHCTLGDSCTRRHSSEPYMWMAYFNGKWIFLEDKNTVIEEAYCDPNVKTFFVIESLPEGGYVEIIFDNMPTSYFPVQRLSTVSYVKCVEKNLDATFWMWCWEDDDGSWKRFNSSGTEPPYQDILETKYLQDQEQNCLFEVKENKYELNFVLMTQTNLTTQKVRNIRRRPLFSKPDKKKIMKLSPHCDDTILPGGWSPMDTDSWETVEWIPMHRYTTKQKAAFDVVAQAFHSTLPSSQFQIVNLCRIQNMDSWKKYAEKKIKMEKQQKKVSELKLFHGTADETTARCIGKQNFDPRMHGVNGTRFGKGAYFARDAKYSHDYTKASASGIRYMFYARVLEGRTVKGKEEYKRPPPVHPNKPDGVLYDTCVDNKTNPSIYVVFEKEQCYPEYLIQYMNAALDQTPVFGYQIGTQSVVPVKHTPSKSQVLPATNVKVPPKKIHSSPTNVNAHLSASANASKPSVTTQPESNTSTIDSTGAFGIVKAVFGWLWS